jgi:hypothetical protein
MIPNSASYFALAAMTLLHTSSSQILHNYHRGFGFGFLSSAIWCLSTTTWSMVSERGSHNLLDKLYGTAVLLCKTGMNGTKGANTNWAPAYLHIPHMDQSTNLLRRLADKQTRRYPKRWASYHELFDGNHVINWIAPFLDPQSCSHVLTDSR